MNSVLWLLYIAILWYLKKCVRVAKDEVSRLRNVPLHGDGLLRLTSCHLGLKRLPVLDVKTALRCCFEVG